ncbi:MAG: LysM peptidoglycan-binding domain-containing protein [Eubacteriales bacterium]|nr:LysM peptidoglycan-binding domain-containing protein [Eubacteriales bacterium]
MTQNNTTGTICAEEYTVKRGDSFYLIAHKLGVPLRDLLAANRDIHPARLMVGDVLCIPREEDDSATNGSASGSTGSGSTGGSTNGSTGTTGGSTSGGSTGGSTGNTNGSTGGSSGSTSGTTDSSSGSTTEVTPSCPVEQQFIIQRGQTVADVQLRTLLSRHTLDTANPGVDLDSLRVGQTICVPTENVPCTLPDTYTLTQSETLEAVAVQFNLPVASILRANPCLAPQDFEAGVTVVLPR